MPFISLQPAQPEPSTTTLGFSLGLVGSSPEYCVTGAVGDGDAGDESVAKRDRLVSIKFVEIAGLDLSSEVEEDDFIVGFRIRFLNQDITECARYLSWSLRFYEFEREREREGLRAAAPIILGRVRRQLDR